MAISEIQPLTYDIATAAKLLGISRRFAYEMARAGRLPTGRRGAKLLAPRAALDRFLGNVSHASRDR